MFAIAGWREDAGFMLLYLTPWSKVRAMQRWIDRSGIAQRRCQPCMTAHS